MDSSAAAIIEALEARRIRAGQSVLLPGWQGVALSMSVVDLERFLDIIVGRPVTEEDTLAARIIGRGQDLTVGDEPWRFELIIRLADAGFEFHAIANIPEADVVEVLYRLAENGESDIDRPPI